MKAADKFNELVHLVLRRQKRGPEVPSPADLPKPGPGHGHDARLFQEFQAVESVRLFATRLGGLHRLRGERDLWERVQRSLRRSALHALEGPERRRHLRGPAFQGGEGGFLLLQPQRVGSSALGGGVDHQPHCNLCTGTSYVIHSRSYVIHKYTTSYVTSYRRPE